MEYDFAADLLNKFSQLTPWVQVTLGFELCTLLVGVAYLGKETAVGVARAFGRN